MRSNVARSSSSGTTPSITPWRCRFSAVWTPVGERLAVELLVHPRAEEADQRAGFGGRHVAERAPRREHPAGRRMPQVHQVRQVRLLVQLDGGGDLDHLQERDRALLHAGAARTRRRHQRQPLGGRAFHGRGDALGGGHADRPGQEVELAGDDGDPTPEHRALAGQHRFVEAGRRPGVGQFAARRTASGWTSSGALSQLTNEPSSSTASRSSTAPIRLTEQGYPAAR